MPNATNFAPILVFYLEFHMLCVYSLICSFDKLAVSFVNFSDSLLIPNLLPIFIRLLDVCMCNSVGYLPDSLKDCQVTSAVRTASTSMAVDPSRWKKNLSLPLVLLSTVRWDSCIYILDIKFINSNELLKADAIIH